jgi:hypothetical protein
MDCKIIITGHTSPMGKGVYDHYSKTYDCLGVSRNTGYDLTKSEDQDRVVSEAMTCDVFLNIAHVGASQSSLLLKLQERWTHDAPLRKVITIGSLATKVPKKLLDQVGIDKQYLKDKHHIDAVHNALANQTPFGPQLKFSLVRVLNYGEKTGDRSGEPTCTAQDIIRTIDYVIDESMYISTLDVRRS